jgi:hypothetical protein
MVGVKMKTKVILMDRIRCWVAWHLSREMVYIVGIRLASNATTGEWAEEDPNKVDIITVLYRWRINSKEKVGI